VQRTEMETKMLQNYRRLLVEEKVRSSQRQKVPESLIFTDQDACFVSYPLLKSVETHTV